MKSQKGFTLIEMVVVIAIIGALGMVIAEMYVWQNRLYNVQTSKYAAMNDVRAALDDIDNYVRSSSLVLGTYSTYTTGTDTLILQIQSINSSNQLLPGTFDTIVYYKTGSELFREVFPDASSSRQAVQKQLAAHVVTLRFTYDNADMAQVTEVDTEFAVTETNQTQNQTISVSSKSHLRNH